MWIHLWPVPLTGLSGGLLSAHFIIRGQKMFHPELVTRGRLILAVTIVLTGILLISITSKVWFSSLRTSSRPPGRPPSRRKRK